MKTLTFLLLIIIYSCAFGQEVIESETLDSSKHIPPPVAPLVFTTTSPCDDSLLNVLRTKDLLDKTEVYYLNEKEEECRAYTDSLNEAIRDSIAAPEKEAKWQKKKQAIIAGIVAGVIAQIVLLGIMISNTDGSWYVEM